MISIFGASGFIGSRFCELYPEESIKISRNCLLSECDEILYFISTIHNYNVYENPLIDIETNLLHLVKILNSHKHNKNCIFNFISSWFVYGKNNNLPFKETDFCNPTGFYSITKRCAEQLVISFCETFNIQYRIFRLANVLGEHDHKISRQKNAIQFMIKELCHNRDIELYDNGNCFRDYIYVDDVCKALKTCMRQSPPNEIINIGSGQPNKLKNIIDKVIQLTQSKSLVKNIEPSRFHKIVQVQDAYLDISKLLSYGYKIETDIDTMIGKLISHYVEIKDP